MPIEKHQKDKMKFYIGIDLGTTNSSLSYIVSKNSDGSLSLETLRFDQEIDEGEREKRSLLPSFVYFEGKDEFHIGEIAKKRIKTNPSRVVRSIKSLIGKPLTEKQIESLTFDGVFYSPEKISSLYLRTLLEGMKETYSEDINIDDAVVTIPASFGPDMRKKTIEAAELAGIRTREEDGSLRRLLLDEPRASLYDFVNTLIHNNKIHEFFGEKEIYKVLVYDLGGGTLDVSCHNVRVGKDLMTTLISDVAISRYTNLGGDTFDKMIAEFLYNEFLKQNNLEDSTLTEIDRSAIKSKLLLHAESLKKALTQIYHRKKSFSSLSRSEKDTPEGESDIREKDKDLYNSIKKKLLMGILLPGTPPFAIELSLEDYVKIVEPLFAYDLHYPNEEFLNNIKDLKDKDNLIYPVLDVLDKAKNQWHLEKPDVILLTGGMTRFPPIEHRLSQFFGKKVHTLLDPDKSVSRGASIYHYLIHHGYSIDTITSEAIYMKVVKDRKEKYKELIPVGVPLTKDKPYTKLFKNTFKISDASKKKYSLPFFRGRDYVPINKRTYVLKNPEVGMFLSMEVSLSVQKILSIKIWIEGENGEKLEEQEMTISTDGMGEEEDKKSIVLSLPTPSVLKKEILTITLKEAKKELDILQALKKKFKVSRELFKKSFKELVNKGHLLVFNVEGQLYYQTSEHLHSDLSFEKKNTDASKDREEHEDKDKKEPIPSLSYQEFERLLTEFVKDPSLFRNKKYLVRFIHSSDLKKILKKLLELLILKEKRKYYHIAADFKNNVYFFFGEVISKREDLRENPKIINRILKELIGFLRYAKKRHRLEHKLPSRFVNEGMKNVIISLGKIGKIDSDYSLPDLLRYFLENSYFKNLFPEIYTALGNLPYDRHVFSILRESYYRSRTEIDKTPHLINAVKKQCINLIEEGSTCSQFNDVSSFLKDLHILLQNKSSLNTKTMIINALVEISLAILENYEEKEEDKESWYELRTFASLTLDRLMEIQVSLEEEKIENLSFSPVPKAYSLKNFTLFLKREIEKLTPYLDIASSSA